MREKEVAPISQPPIVGKGKKPSWQNQRATVRYRCAPATTGKVYLPEDLEFQRAWLQDLSASGIGLILSKSLDIGLFVNIQLKSPNSNKSYSIPAHVVHATDQSSGEWIIGCEFVTRLTSDEVDDLL